MPGPRVKGVWWLLLGRAAGEHARRYDVGADRNAQATKDGSEGLLMRARRRAPRGDASCPSLARARCWTWSRVASRTHSCVTAFISSCVTIVRPPPLGWLHGSLSEADRNMNYFTQRGLPAKKEEPVATAADHGPA